MESRKLHDHDGTERGIDVGIAVDHTLYVVECKRRVRGIRIDRGDWSARLNCQETLAEDLVQARTLAKFFQEERSGKDYEVPTRR
jgi:hypothetical protein